MGVWGMCRGGGGGSDTQGTMRDALVHGPACETCGHTVCSAL